MRSQGNRSQQSVLSEGVLPHLVGVFHTGEGGNACLELRLQVRVVQDPQGTSIDVIDNALLHSQKERLAFIYQDLRHVLVHDDRTLDGILGKILEFDSLVDLAFNSFDSGGHLVGLDLAHTVLSPQISAETDEVVDLLLELSSAALLEVALGHVLHHAEGILHSLFAEHLPDLLAVAHLLAQLLGELLHQSGLHGDQLVLELGVALAAHVDRDDQLLDAGVLGLEVLEADLLQRVQHLVVLLRVLHHGLQFGGAGAAEDLALGSAGEWAGHRKVRLAVVADHVADRLADLELPVREGFVEDGVAFVDLMVADLTISHKDDIPVALLDYLLSNITGTGAACPSLALDAGLELLLSRESALRVPEVIVRDVLGVLVEDVADGLPIVLTAPYRAGVIDKQRIRVLHTLHYSQNYKGSSHKCILIIIL